MRSTTWLTLVALLGVLLASGGAWAGELRFGAEPLETDAKGRLTEAGKAAAVTEVEAEPGDRQWTLYLYAQLGNQTAQGPLYVEIYRERNGKQLVAFRKEYPDYDGARYVSMDLELDRSDGFAAGQTVEVALVQSVGKRTAKWAKAPLTLLASSAPPPEPEEEEEDIEDDLEDEDDLDGEDEDDLEEAAATAPPQPAAPPSEPPPVTTNKRGCRMGGPSPSAWLVLVVLVAARRRRRA